MPCNSMSRQVQEALTLAVMGLGCVSSSCRVSKLCRCGRAVGGSGGGSNSMSRLLLQPGRQGTQYSQGGRTGKEG